MMPAFKPTIYVGQLVRTELTIEKITDVSRKERSSNFCLRSYWVEQVTKTGFLGAGWAEQGGSNMLLIFQAISKRSPAKIERSYK